MIQLHPSHYSSQGTIELTVDVDYTKLSNADRAFVNTLVRRFEERATVKIANEKAAFRAALTGT